MAESPQDAGVFRAAGFAMEITTAEITGTKIRQRVVSCAYISQNSSFDSGPVFPPAVRQLNRPKQMHGLVSTGKALVIVHCSGLQSTPTMLQVQLC